MMATDTVTLPEDKRYHALFSFQSDDRVWVRKTLETLEAEPHRLKCCFADRDFHPGKEVMHNIEACMHQSTNIILVISPEHLESHYCEFETNMAMELAHQKEARVIPVLRRGDTVPASLRFINYVDARDHVDENEVIDKLVKAITQGLDTIATTYSLIESSSSRSNGEEINLMAIHEKRGCFPSPFCTVPQVSDDQLRECHSLGVQMTNFDMFILNKLINSYSFIRDNWIFFAHSGRVLLLLYVTLVIGWLLTLTITPLRGTAQYDDTAIILFTCGLIPGTAFIYCVIMLVGMLKATIQKDKLSGRISVSCYQKNVLICIGNKQYQPVLRFVAYNVTECKSYVTEKLCSAIGGMSESVMEEVSEQIIKEGIATYVKLFMSPPDIAPRKRHTVKGDRLCLCQYIEDKGIHTKVQKQFHQHYTSPHELTELLIAGSNGQKRRREDEQLLLQDENTNDTIIEV